MIKAGIFAAYARPDAVVQDLRSMLGNGGGAFGVVAGKDGHWSCLMVYMRGHGMLFSIP